MVKDPAKCPYFRSLSKDQTTDTSIGKDKSKSKNKPGKSKEKSADQDKDQGKMKIARALELKRASSLLVLMILKWPTMLELCQRGEDSV